MGDFSMICGISGLGIPAGTPVRCLLLTASPHAQEEPRHAWIPRTPPLRATYNGYGSIERVHEEDGFIADLWLRGFQEDLITKAPKDTASSGSLKDPSLEELVTDAQSGRVKVRQDTKHFWRRPLVHAIVTEGRDAPKDKQLPIALAMIREDVWQAIANYPHSELVDLDGTHRCGTCLAYVVDNNATVWYGLEVFCASARATWQEILEHFAGKPRETTRSAELTALVEAMLQRQKEVCEKEASRVAALPVDERTRLEVAREAQRAAWEAEERSRRENPCFGDFLIDARVARDSYRPGDWIFRVGMPGVIGISEHLSMCLADRREVPLSTIDAIAELAAVSQAIAGVGVTWKPAESTGPQYPEWGENLRFARTVLQIAQAADNGTSSPAYAKLSEVPRCHLQPSNEDHQRDH